MTHPLRQPRVFISSTSKDLEAYRKAAQRTLYELHWTADMMELAPPGALSTVDECYQRLDQCDLVLLIVAFRRGWVPSGAEGGNGVDSITALELQHARRRGKDVLVFLADEQWPGNLWEDGEQDRAWVKAFRANLNQAAKPFAYDRSGNPELVLFSAAVKDALVQYQARLIKARAAALSAAPSPIVTPERAPEGAAQAAFVRSLEDVPESWECHPLQSAEHFQSRPEQTQLTHWLATARHGVFALIGLGGAGKTAIVEQLVRSLDHPEKSPAPRHVSARFVFSFYSADATVDSFFAALGSWLSAGRGSLLDAEAIRHALVQLGRQSQHTDRKLLLVLDGLEEVQHGDGTPKRLGSLTDRRLSVLLDMCAAGSMPGVCVVVTTRLPLADIELQRRKAYVPQRLERMSTSTAVALLRALGLTRASDDELQRLCADYAEHALTIDLLGNFIARFHGGDVESFRRMEQHVDWMHRAAQLDAGGVADLATAVIQRESAKLGRIAAFYFTELERSAPDALALIKFITFLHLPASAQRLAGLAPSAGHVGAASIESVSARLRYLHGLGLLSRTDDDGYVMHPGIREAFRELTTGDKDNLQRAIIGQLRVELQDRAAEPVLDSRRIDLLRAYALHLLDWPADAAAEDCASSIKLAWGCVTDPAPTGLGGWLELTWGSARIASAVAQVCAALDACVDRDPRVTHPEQFHRVWATALRNQGQLDAAKELLQRALQGADAASDKLHIEGCNDTLSGLLKEETGHLRQALELARSKAPNAHALLNIADLLGRTGNVHEAWAHIDLALASARQSLDVDAWGHDARLARSFRALGAYREAIDLALQGAHALQKSHGQASLAVRWALGIVADASLMLGDFDASCPQVEGSAGGGSNDLIQDAEERLHALRVEYHRVATTNGPEKALQPLEADLLSLVDELAGYGAAVPHARALLALADVALLLHKPTEAWIAASRALYGSAANPAMSEEGLFGPRAVALALTDDERNDPRGVFPPRSSGLPVLLGIAHDFRRERNLEPRAHLLRAKALLMSADAGAASPQEKMRALALRLLGRCIELRVCFHVTQAIAELDAVHTQARALVALLERADPLDRQVLAAPEALALRVEPHPKPPLLTADASIGLRPYCYSLHFPSSRRPFAEALVRALTEQGVARERILIDVFPSNALPPKTAELCREKALLSDSSVLLVLDAADGDEAWSGCTPALLAVTGPATQIRSVYLRDPTQRRTLPEHVEQLNITAPLQDLVASLGKKLKAVRQQELAGNRLYYLRFHPPQGRRAYYFLLVESHKERAFLAAMDGTERFSLEDYGSILKSGFGDPSPALKAEMKARWDITYDDEG